MAMIRKRVLGWFGAITLGLFAGLALTGGAGSGSSPEIRLTVLYDNFTHAPGTQADWGFAGLIEGTEKTILFDTGAKRDVFWKNVDALEAGIAKVEVVVISHVHQDHTGGLDSVLEKKKGIPVYIPADSPDDFVKNIENNGGWPEKVTKPVSVCKDVLLFPNAGAVEEVGLVLRGAEGSALLTGCAHPGIVAMVRSADEALKDKVRFVLGGFHLLSHSEAQIRQIINDFMELGVEKCGATHCTGDPAVRLFKEAFGANFVPLGVGKVVIF